VDISLKLNFKNKSISIKLFILTSIFFLFFISVTMILQSIFIEKFYLNSKLSNFKKSFQAFKLSYEENSLDEYTIANSMNSFEINNNAKIAMLDLSNGNILITQDNNANQVGLSKTDTDKNKFGTIASAFKEWLSLPEFLLVTKKGYTVSYISNLKYNGISSIVSVTPIIENGNINSIFIAISSLQPVGEASLVIRNFYKYFYALAIILIVILSFFYTNMISKPLKKLNQVVLKMSQLDFTQKYIVTTDDEIGNLGKAFNFLSDNLNNSLTKLKVANEKLKEDIEKEKKLEKMRKEFVAGVSHDLKTPIAIISGYAEGLKDNIVEGEEKKYYVDVIIDESQKMSVLISDMLDLSQLESGNFNLHKCTFNIIELINSIVKKYFNIFESKSIKFEFTVAIKISQVFGDVFRVEQVITNLLDNAIKNTSHNCNIYISLEQADDRVIFEIENEGMQIPEEELQNIWEKFYKVDKSRNRIVGGTGIGLSIVKNIISLHGGNFGVKNTKTGVKFYFDIKIV